LSDWATPMSGPWSIRSASATERRSPSCWLSRMRATRSRCRSERTRDTTSLPTEEVGCPEFSARRDGCETGRSDSRRPAPTGTCRCRGRRVAAIWARSISSASSAPRLATRISFRSRTSRPARACICGFSHPGTHSVRESGSQRTIASPQSKPVCAPSKADRPNGGEGAYARATRKRYSLASR
jgi:hypothetical protein